MIPIERPRGDYAQGYICPPCTSETVRTPCPICSVRISSGGISKRAFTYFHPRVVPHLQQ